MNQIFVNVEVKGSPACVNFINTKLTNENQPMIIKKTCYNVVYSCLSQIPSLYSFNVLFIERDLSLKSKKEDLCNMGEYDKYDFIIIKESIHNEGVFPKGIQVIPLVFDTLLKGYGTLMEAIYDTIKYTIEPKMG